jgi:hypothetical protein
MINSKRTRTFSKMYVMRRRHRGRKLHFIASLGLELWEHLLNSLRFRSISSSGSHLGDQGTYLYRCLYWGILHSFEDTKNRKRRWCGYWWCEYGTKEKQFRTNWDNCRKDLCENKKAKYKNIEEAMQQQNIIISIHC